MAGYSNTPLLKKLGIKEGFTLAFVNAPEHFADELGSLPADAILTTGRTRRLDFAIVFAFKEKILKREFERVARELLADGMLWVAWPKKSSGVSTDLSFVNVQKIGLAAGLVDVKICAINDVWSGLKFVYRVRDRHQVG